MTDLDSGVFAVICEFKNQAPILMETEGMNSSFDEAEKRRHALLKNPEVIRACVVKVSATSTWAGNTLLIEDMKRMQK